MSASAQENEPNGSLDSSNQIGAGQVTTGSNGPGDVDIFRIDTASDGLLVARLQAPFESTRLSLLDPQGVLLVRNDGISPGNPDEVIRQHLGPGTYFLEVVQRRCG